MQHPFPKVSLKFHKKHEPHSTDAFSSTCVTSQQVVHSTPISLWVRIEPELLRSTRVQGAFYLCWKSRGGNVDQSPNLCDSDIFLGPNCIEIDWCVGAFTYVGSWEVGNVVHSPTRIEVELCANGLSITQNSANFF